ncbi:YggS family pyridoxal phosphate-dependent enzyme [Candidatus Pelagibacter sp.]|jgi:pyridoxal phosphate enzyme (YggS family)|uniref:YggS family pyridoxal phosphate-dependent enzyme n=1 Tax=Candidatus Pelagibacter sp. TaxID=2024849 RepID=UPI003F86201E|tara:strand:- start:306 stop:965 length:660 start_codon:yes stop_codon:yes gene_type:complete
MHDTIKNLLDIKNNIKFYLEKLNINSNPKILAVSKTFEINKILPLIEYGHLHYGENKVQEALEKWSDIKLTKKDLKLHLIGKLQTNKVKQAIKIFDYIHSVDSKKLAKKIADEETKQGKKIKIFIQVNIGDEEQKSGVNKSSVNELYSYCKAINLNVIGLMCIPPLTKSSDIYFKEMNILNKNLNLNELSMGMSSDYLDAIKNSATYVRIGSNIFGQRS